MSETKTSTEDASITRVRGSPLAIASMVLGIAAVPLGCVVVGIPVGLAALALGIVGLVQINRQPLRYWGKGLALTGIVAGGIVGMVVSPLLMVLLQRARESSGRFTCAENLRDISQSMHVYGAENHDQYPLLPFAVYGRANGGTSTATLAGRTEKDALAELFSDAGPETGSPLASVWVLVIQGSLVPKSFLCNGDSVVRSGGQIRAPGGGYFASVQADNQISYSFAYPYTTGGLPGPWWRAISDSSIPVAADINPLAGTGSPPRDPAGGIGKGRNSANHRGDGQSVAFGDAHVEFQGSPEVGQGGDNIYTVGDATGGSRTGTAVKLGPLAPGGAAGNFDTVMVPARDLDTGKLW